MRNLRFAQHRVLTENQRPSACAWNPSTDDIIYTHGPSVDSSLVQLRRYNFGISARNDADVVNIASWESPSPSPDLDSDSILSLKYLTDLNIYCLVLRGGDIIAVREQPSYEEDKIEIVGSIDCGVDAVSWSPDGELLAIISNEKKLLLISRNFEVIATTALNFKDLEASKHVSVGWGKSETQFKGRGVKALRDPTLPEKINKGLFSPHEDHRTSISWRGDGAFLAVSSTKESSRRVIRIYTRDGNLEGVSEPVDFLEGLLSWRPSGNLIAAVKRSDSEASVVFFEKNGLIHGGFPLRPDGQNSFKDIIISELIYNSDSSLLAVICNDRIQLWTMGNYHYYLKQDIEFTQKLDNRGPVYAWHPEKPLLFLSNLGDGALHRVGFTWHISKGSLNPPCDNGSVAVIDGAIVNLTPFRMANVPPPMALQQLTVDEPVIDVAIWDDSRNSVKLAVLMRNRIEEYAWSITKTTAPGLTHKISIQCIFDKLATASPPLRPQQVEFMGPSTLLLLVSNQSGSFGIVISLQTANDNYLESCVELGPTQQILFGSCDKKPKLWYAALSSGQLISIDQSKTTKNNEAFSADLERVDVVNLSEEGHQIQEPETSTQLVVTLTKDGLLYAADRCIAENSHHLLKFIHLSPALDMQIPPDTPESDERCRCIERGARIITVIPSRSALILQMPRGNLETIFPRALILAEVRRRLDLGSFKAAFMYCRNHRVDMNILHDYAPEKFIAHVPDFVRQISRLEYIDLFLSQLRDEDVSVTMYRETLRDRSCKDRIAEIEGQSKTNRVCDAFLEALRTVGKNHVQNIITAHCSKNPPDLEAGLREIAKLDGDIKEKGVEHICFLVDVNKLFDAALGLYDINLALHVAQQSQKDPREYLPFLQNLRQQPLIRMKFSIDDHLGYRVKSVKHLHDLDEFDELKNYVLKHNLYEEAMELYSQDESRISELLGLYAEHLFNTASFHKAGVAYEYLRDYSAASNSYRLAHMWQEALLCAELSDLPGYKFQEFANIIVESLVESRDFRAAATISSEYLSDPLAAATLFCKGYYYTEASRIIARLKDPKLWDTILDPGLIEGMGVVMGLIADCKAQLEAQTSRLSELRIKKQENSLSFIDGAHESGTTIPDNLSLAGSEASTIGGSLLTRYTNRTGSVGTGTSRQTSKNRRREERKRAKGRKGTVFEEDYLVNSIKRLIERVNGIHDDVSRLTVGLFRRRMRDKAAAVENAMLSMVTSCQLRTPEAFGMAQQIPLDLGTSEPIAVEAVNSLGDLGQRNFNNEIQIKPYVKTSFLGN